MLECGFNCLRRESLKLEDWQTRRSDATKFDLQSMDSGCRNVQEEMEQLGNGMLLALADEVMKIRREELLKQIGAGNQRD